MSYEKPRSIVIVGRRWRDRNGNTYHSVEVFVDGSREFAEDYVYGYGVQYVETAKQGLEGLGLLPGLTDTEALWTYCRRNGIELAYTVADVARKADL